MSGFTLALLLALLPAAGNFVGGLAAEFTRVSQRTLSFALHSAAGILFAVVGMELMPEALSRAPAWLMLLAFVAGGAAAVLLDRLIEFVRARSGAANTANISSWGIYSGVAVDLFSDGVIIGTGSLINPSLGLLLALGQVPADIPEGFATIATFKKSGLTRTGRLLVSASFALPILLGATVGYWAVRGQPEAVKLGLLSFTAGILLTVAVEEIVVQAHEEEDSRWASLFLVGGFALFALLASYIDS
jgi:ZIP family zinc transporter